MNEKLIAKKYISIHPNLNGYLGHVYIMQRRDIVIEYWRHQSGHIQRWRLAGQRKYLTPEEINEIEHLIEQGRLIMEKFKLKIL